MKKKFLGNVMLYTPSLVLADPVNIKEGWKNSEEILGCQFWGAGEEEVKKILEEQGIQVNKIHGAYRVDAEHAFLVEQAINQGTETVLFELIKNDSMQKCFDIGDGEIEDIEGVTVSTEVKGSFPVYAIYDDDGFLVKCEIQFMDEEVDENQI